MRDGGLGYVDADREARIGVWMRRLGTAAQFKVFTSLYQFALGEIFAAEKRGVRIEEVTARDFALKALGQRSALGDATAWFEQNGYLAHPTRPLPLTGRAALGRSPAARRLVDCVAAL